MKSLISRAPAAPALGGKFELGCEIGEGGMGKVFEAFDRELERKVAVKVMLPALRQDPKAKDRFLNEAKVVAGLRHPYIVSIYEIIERGPDLFLVLEYVEGEPLSKLLAPCRAVPLSECGKILDQVCQAVGYAHKHRVIHRDLKPSNIMIDANGFVKVMDFGLARLVKDTVSRVTSCGASGSPAYMAPEQHMGRACRETDIYALGVCLYEMAAGPLPFPGGDLLARKERKAFEKPSAVNPSLPAALDALIDRALNPEPKRRFSTATQFLEALKKC